MSLNIEYTSDKGGSKWVKDVVSHNQGQIKEAWDEGRKIDIKSRDGSTACVDMNKVFFMRFQDGEVFERRSRRVMDDPRS